jgi:hypothetical protein
MSSSKKPASERFKSGDIIRYGSGISALFRYEGTHNQHMLYGSHVMGGVHGSSDQMFFDLQPASAEDIEFCKAQRPEWFSAPAIFYTVFELNRPAAEPFGVIAADTSKRSGDGIEGTVMSLHWTRAAAEAAARQLTTCQRPEGK